MTVGGYWKPSTKSPHSSLVEKFIGPHTTRLAIKTFAHKTLGVAPNEVRDREVPDLIRALRPLLRSMLGEAQGERIVEQLLAECKP